MSESLGVRIITHPTDRSYFIAEMSIKDGIIRYFDIKRGFYRYPVHYNVFNLSEIWTNSNLIKLMFGDIIRE